MDSSNKNAITQLLRDKTSNSLVSFAKQHKTTRQSVYEAIEGKGSRRIRVEIAKAVEIPPSMLWANNPKTTRTVDDLHYIGCAND
jgi:lambda repressor-like predicted transcriptional regulator